MVIIFLSLSKLYVIDTLFSYITSSPKYLIVYYQIYNIYQYISDCIYFYILYLRSFFSFRNSQFFFQNIFTSGVSLEGKCLVLLTPLLKALTVQA